MRCKCCDKFMSGEDFTTNPLTGEEEDICQRCIGEAFNPTAEDDGVMVEYKDDEYYPYILGEN